MSKRGRLFVTAQLTPLVSESVFSEMTDGHQSFVDDSKTDKLGSVNFQEILLESDESARCSCILCALSIHVHF